MEMKELKPGVFEVASLDTEDLDAVLDELEQDVEDDSQDSEAPDAPSA